MREVQHTSQRIDWATEDQMSKVDSVLKSLARDWSVEGIKERSVVYDRMLMALDKFLPLDTNGLPPRICVPGSGAFRLIPLILSILFDLLTTRAYNILCKRIGKARMGNTLQRLHS